MECVDAYKVSPDPVAGARIEECLLLRRLNADVVQ